ncbi:MAG: glycosyltransferase involved in cell wall biosynthesis [Planctomycetota bacterium]|jgi:glycosyltransferase involved in cell wall biosynthesis
MAKVVVVAPYVPFPARHGGAIRSRVLLDALCLDHEVHLAAAVANDEDRANAKALEADAGIVVHALPAYEAPRPSLPRKLHNWLRGRSEVVRRRWPKQAATEMTRIFGQVGCDLRVVDSTFALPVITHPCDLLYLHNLEHSMFDRQDGEQRRFSDRLTRRMEARGLRSYEKRAIEQTPLTVTVSEHDRSLALGLVPSARVEAVSNSVDLERLPLLPAPACGAVPRLLFVGSLDYPPNLEAATELVERHVPALREAFPELTVRLVGKDPHGHGARFRGIAGVEVIGPVDDIVEHYRDTHAVYLPIRSGGGTRIKILEAWALGVPVLSTAVGCEGLPANDGVHLHRFETPEQGCGKLRRVMADASHALRQNGRQLVEQHFSHAAAIARLRVLASDLLAQRAD